MSEAIFSVNVLPPAAPNTRVPHRHITISHLPSFTPDEWAVDERESMERGDVTERSWRTDGLAERRTLPKATKLLVALYGKEAMLFKRNWDQASV